MKNKKIILISIILIICIIIFFIIIPHKKLVNNNSISYKKENINDGIEYTICDNKNGIITALVEITRIDGIDKIEYVDIYGKNKVLECYGKKKIGIDDKFYDDREYEYKVTSNGVEKVEKIHVKIDGILAIQTIDDDDLETTKVKVSIDNEISNNKTLNLKGTKWYYAYNDSNIWREVTDSWWNGIKLDLAHVDENRIATSQSGMCKIKLKINNSKGHTIAYRYGDVLVESTIFNIFAHTMIANNNLNIIYNRTEENDRNILDQYGFSSGDQDGNDAYTYYVSQLYVGHYSGTYEWYGVFNLDAAKLNKIRASSLDNYFYQYVEGGAYVDCKVEITYMDNSNTSNSIYKDTDINETNHVIVNLDNNKQIKNIVFRVDGADGYGNGAEAALTRIVMRRSIFCYII